MPKLLFVDDDVTLLRSLERNLCFDYEMQTAESGAAALELLAKDNSIAVVVTDMKMPEMNGLQLIEQARRIAPHSIYIMLTGNQDIDTTIAAVNDGSVFRFLNKPCSVTDIKRAVDAALKQHDLIFAEKDLLQRTFVGAVNLLTDVLASLKPELLDQSRCIDETMQRCEKALGGTGSYEYRLAAKLGLVGFALLPESEQLQFRKLCPSDTISREILRKIVEVTSRLVGRIPRLARIAELIRLIPQVDGRALQGTSDLKSLEVGAGLLKLAIHWTTMMHRDIGSSEALGHLRIAMPGLPTAIEDALLVRRAVSQGGEAILLNLCDLKEGMVLRHHVEADDGRSLIRAGQPLTETAIEKLKLHGRSLGRDKFAVEPSSTMEPATAGSSS